ncbi:hypothetical protein ALO95_200390 [Pseudomonas syringae pv. antirrhini]|uniref:LysR family transcriptional regulator n=1 Tax=Pseudomonas TaxID=286 RepID=UPI00070C220B|nr:MULTISPECIES: LysR family transcriptional regulator [Pseudomonas]RMP42551.1 hypothetical protein ALQ23_200125 [Pseudomonas syringae pv. antirrhini]RMW23439.1 hypothetical protein ALO95_200390 [Pseudomonas syringae pv. antirrhini]WIN08819.1 LysR family transcriptional regulator [Pseudomonas syringae pv. antirrhini str. 126]
MPREHYSDLIALVAVAEARSFTAAAAKLGISQSTLSHTIRQLESRLGVRLLTRTTRNVSVTESGEKLLKVAAPRLRDIENQLRAIADSGSLPSGTVRIVCSEYAANTVVWPTLAKLLPEHPRIKVEVVVEQVARDLAQGRFDLGVRLGDELDKDTAGVRIGPDLKFVIVGAPAYFSAKAVPLEPEDLLEHDCITLMSGGQNLFPWALKKGMRATVAKVDGRLSFSGVYQVLNAALEGFGLAYIPEALAQPHIVSGDLIAVLPEWWQSFPGFHLYYTKQPDMSRAVKTVLATFSNSQ